MAIYDPFAEFEPQPLLSTIVTTEIINPVPGNSLLELNLTDFEKGLLIAFILIYLMGEI